MKYAKKYMVVPYIKKLENPDEKYVSDLDRDIGDVLTDSSKSIDEKVKLYNVALEKFKLNYDRNPQSEESKALSKISSHLDSFMTELNNNKNIKEENHEPDVNPVFDYKINKSLYKTYPYNLDNFTFDDITTKYNETDYDINSELTNTNNFNSKRKIENGSPMDISMYASPYISNDMKPVEYNQAAPKLLKPKLYTPKLQTPKFKQNTRSNHTPLKSGLLANNPFLMKNKKSKTETPKFTQRQSQKSEKTPVLPRTYNKQGTSLTPSLSKIDINKTDQQGNGVDRWTSNRSGYFR